MTSVSMGKLGPSHQYLDSICTVRRTSKTKDSSFRIKILLQYRRIVEFQEKWVSTGTSILKDIVSCAESPKPLTENGFDSGAESLKLLIGNGFDSGSLINIFKWRWKGGC